MLEILINFLSGIPAWLATIILAMIPIGELRGSLPVAIEIYKFPVWLAIILSLVGNLIPVYFLLIFFEKISKWMRNEWLWADNFFNWLFDRTRRKLEQQVERYGVWALILFVGIPLPVTGAWTGSLAAFVFGLPRKQAFAAIALGLCLSAIIVTAITLGVGLGIRSLI